MRKKTIFKRESNKTLKYFIAAFSAFIVILAAASAIILFSSDNFDLSRISGKAEQSSDKNESETAPPVYSVDSLTGRSQILFLCTDDDGVFDFAFTVVTDFDNKTMQVKCYEDDTALSLNGNTISCRELYGSASLTGLVRAMEGASGIGFEKYIKFTDTQLKDILKLFGKFTLNIPEPVNYRSDEYNLELAPGIQALSDDLTYKYVMTLTGYDRTLALCDIISSVLTAEFADSSQELFSEFVNLCDTNISVIDYSECAQQLNVYCKADDKFFPAAVK